MKRRTFVKTAGAGILTALAGCNTTDGSGDQNQGNQDESNSDNDNNSGSQVSVTISNEENPAELPSIWEGQSIEDFQAQFTVEASGNPSSVTVSNGDVEIDRNSDQWQGSKLTVQPGQMKKGEQEFTATASSGSAEAQDTAPAVKSTPSNYKVDLVPQRNEELRNQISQNSLEDNYLEKRGGFITSDPVIDNYSSHEQLGFNKFGIDLAAFSWLHDGDYATMKSHLHVQVKDFVDSIGVDTGDSDIEAIKSGDQVPAAIYPNGSMAERRGGNFDFEQFSNAETVGEALDWVHPYLFNWQAKMTPEGPFSSEDDLYAIALEEAIEQNNRNLDVHAWDVGLGGGHGNGLIYGKNADGTEELRVMETVSAPVTSEGADNQLHPLIEDSNYLNPSHDAFEQYWHPLRFGWGDKGPSDNYGFGFEGRKTQATRMIKDMAQSAQFNINQLNIESLAATTEYVQDFTEKLRNFNSNDADFGELYNQAKVMQKMNMDTETNHVIYGNTENPQYAVVDDGSLLEDIWEDSGGEYDDFNQFLRDNPEYSMSMDDVDTSLEGEEVDDFGQQVLAGA